MTLWKKYAVTAFFGPVTMTDMDSVRVTARRDFALNDARIRARLGYWRSRVEMADKKPTNMGECYQCEFWDSSQWIMSKYGEGCGRCQMDGQIRFCTHSCPFASLPEKE